jgi:hypothetical protein
MSEEEDEEAGAAKVDATVLICCELNPLYRGNFYVKMHSDAATGVILLNFISGGWLGTFLTAFPNPYSDNFH